jgi:hypothetical protein
MMPFIRATEFLDGELAGVVAGQVLVTLIPCLAKLLDEEVHRLIPAHRLKLPMLLATYHRRGSTASSRYGNLDDDTS